MAAVGRRKEEVAENMVSPWRRVKEEEDEVAKDGIAKKRAKSAEEEREGERTDL